ncbi:MAG TPA: trigger factor [Lachnospiraceae bacterium]|nr:trigger factor [Lachnospiraceae bacterium]
MKKENRKMAQELRAKERAAAARRKKTQKIVITVLVLVAVAVVAAGIILTSTSVGKESSSSSESVVSASASSAGAVTGTSSSSEKKLDTTKGAVVQAGDTINLDYVGSVDGIEFEGGSTQGQGTDLTLGSGTYIDGFEEAVEGHKVGESFDIHVTFPENYGNSDLAGKDAVFNITINGVYK